MKKETSLFDVKQMLLVALIPALKYYIIPTLEKNLNIDLNGDGKISK